MLHLQSISFRFVRHVRWASSSSYVSSNLPSVTLYQYNICPFCHKTKAFLGFVGIRPSIIEVNPLTRSELPSGTTYRKVPIAILDDTTQVNGSDDIVSALMKHPSIQERWKDHALFQVHDDTWVSFANDELAALIYPNLCRTLRESYQAFGYVDDVTAFSNIQKMMIRTLGSLAMYMAASRVKAKRGITDELQALQKALDTIQESGLRNQEYLSGQDTPNLGDLAVFGTLRSVEGLPVHVRIMSKPENILLSSWYDRMKQHIP